MKNFSYIIPLFFILILSACNDTSEEKDTAEKEVPVEVESKEFYGFSEDEYNIIHDTIENNQFLSDILLPHGVSYAEIENIANNSRDVFDVRSMKSGRPIHLICEKDSVGKAYCMIYEKDPVNFVNFFLGDSLYASEGMKEVVIKEAEASGIINSSLFMTMIDQNLTPALAMEMANIYAWTIDFYRLDKGDKFKIIYEQKYVDDEFIGVGDVKACLFQRADKDFYAFGFESDSTAQFYDEEGFNLRRAFLKSPLKFGRLSSRYTMRRFHPVQKRNKPHLGTDYAAATGTPILATRNGTVIESTYRGGNGNYVKIKHNNTYSTQYLHMSKRAVKVGDHVNQGDVIGYVGSTGLSTGPHVCYRFWKNGKQVDHLRENFEPADPISEELRAEFDQVKEDLKVALDKIAYPVQNDALAQTQGK